ncbi:AraC family transcriptional regulator [uncultured Microbulbifer sp.]|uniref:AraC family transcriptional regulator n=1 Tax=uncultured Microbulbifer sp. TaxID=348147 RepID=UPI0025E0FEA8|nr:AraC family transcriptional regulator [uncultured Microbulbifer sp.]
MANKQFPRGLPLLPMVRASALTGYKTLLSSFGVDVGDLLRRLSLPADYLERPDLMIPMETKVELLELGAQLSGCEHFGLRLAQQQNISALGTVGLLLQQCATLGDALETVTSAIGQTAQGLKVWVEERQGKGEERDLVCLCSQYEFDGPSAHSRQHSDNLVAGGVNMIRFLLAEPLQLEAVYLCGPAPATTAATAAYRELFRCPVHFDQEFNGIAFSRDLLARPVAGASPAMRGLIDNFLKKKQLDGFQEQLLWTITNLLPRGPVTLEKVADSVNMAPRTLQLRLSQQGTSFQQLLDRTRVEQVCTYLLEGNLSLTEIAELVGYSQLSALTRAFKRIMGASPRAWLRQHPG